MKQEILKYFPSIEKDMFNVAKYLYNNPEESFCEYKACDYLINILKNNSFSIEDKFLNIPTAFKATLGKGHPKVCYICEYDSINKNEDILGRNLVSAISIGASIGLSKVISKIGGSIIVLGCPGELAGGSKAIMAKEGVFNDIDVVLMAGPNVVNANCNSSPAVLPIRITYSCLDSCCTTTNDYSAFDACLFTLNSINTIAKGYSKNCSIDKINITGDLSPYIPSNTIESIFSIKAPTLNIANEIKSKIETIALSLNKLMNINAKVTLTQIPYEGFKCNETLTRIFTHNCKEVGIIDIDEELDLNYGLSIGNLSSIVPTLKYFVSITTDASIKFASKEFSKTTLSEYALKKAVDISKALCITAVDLIESENLLLEAKQQ